MNDGFPKPGAADKAALVSGLLAVSFSAIIIRLCTAPPSQIAFYRTLLAGGVFLAWEWFRHGRVRISRRDFALAVLAGAFLAAHFYLWIASLFMTSIHSSVVLLATQPLFALVLQVAITGKSATARNLLSLGAGMWGAWILASGDLSHGALAGRGDVFAILSAAMAACYLFTGSYRRSPLIPYLSTVYLSAGMMLLVTTVVIGQRLTPSRTADWFWFALLTIVPTLIGHTMLNRSTRHFPQYVVNLSVLTEPILTGFWAWLLFGEKVTQNVLIGGAIIIVAVAIEFLPFGRRGTPTPEKAEVPHLAD